MPKVDYGNGLTVNYTDGEYERLQEVLEKRGSGPPRKRLEMQELALRKLRITISLPVWLHDLMDKDSTARGEGANEYIQDAILRKATGVENEPST